MASETPLRIVFVGHVDHGKSTLVGRLFNDTGSLPEGKLEQIQAVCERRGVPFEWAFLMDALQAERDQNITIDTSQIWFRTEKRPYVIIDAPGHREFLKNMITGAASADAAFLLIAANEGVREQSRRHGYMLSLLGIRQVVVLVNKMDLVDHSQETFDEIEHEYREFLSQIGLTPIRFVPVSARDGDNISNRSEHTDWYDGPTVVESLDAFNYPKFDDDLPLRFPIQDVYRFDARRILSGRIESGTISVGDELIFQPFNKTAKVASIERWNASSVDTASAGESIGITLDEQIFVERGHTGAHVDTAPMVTNRVRANVFWMGRNPLTKNASYRIKLATQELECRITSFERVIDASTLEPVERDNTLQKDDVAEVIIETKFPLAADLHSEIHALGRFVLVDGYDLSGGGILTELLAQSAELKSSQESSARPVSTDERFSTGGHKGMVLWLSERNDAREEFGVALERQLFNRSIRAMHINRTTLRDFTNLSSVLASLALAGVVAIVDLDEDVRPPEIETLLAKCEAGVIELGSSPDASIQTSYRLTDLDRVLDDLLTHLRQTWSVDASNI